MAPVQPQLHFPSPYLLPTAALTRALCVAMPDGAQIATFVYGAQDPAATTPVLLLHGNGEEHGIFGQVIDAAVRAGHTVVAPDSRGQGKSTRGTAPLTYELMAEDALRVLDALGVTRAHVLGFSDGGIEALLMARDHGNRVATLVAEGANLTPEGVLDEDGGLLDARRALDAWADYWEGSDAPGAVDVALLTPTPEEARHTSELLRLMEVEPHIEAASLGRITCPTTVLVGEFDMIDPAQTRAICDSIPGAVLEIVPGCGHTLPKEAPDAVADCLLRTLARCE